MNHFQKFYHKDLKKRYKLFLGPEKIRGIVISNNKWRFRGNYKKVILDNIIGDTEDVYQLFDDLKKHTTEDSTILITYHNHIWEPLLEVASKFNLRKRLANQNWLDEEDLKNLLEITGYDVISVQRSILIPADIPFISSFINNLIAILPIINNLCLSISVVARPKFKKEKDYSISIVIPARNEEGNISKIISSIPKFGRSQEIIFVEGHSFDKTWKEILKETKNSKNNNIFRTTKAFKQNGKGKANAVWLGFEKATGEILMIYDADRTVEAKDLYKFYLVLRKNPYTFVNGSRMVYPMENQAMRTLNKLGNKIFSLLFTWILGQRFKDTLCGTKAIFKKEFLFIKRNYKRFFDMDPFGDFVLIFGAIKQNLKIVEIPVRYKERSYGSTNINRVRHGLMLLKMTFAAFKEFKL